MFLDDIGFLMCDDEHIDANKSQSGYRHPLFTAVADFVNHMMRRSDCPTECLPLALTYPSRSLVRQVPSYTADLLHSVHLSSLSRKQVLRRQRLLGEILGIAQRIRNETSDQRRTRNSQDTAISTVVITR